MRALIALATVSVGCSKLLGITDPSVGGDARDGGDGDAIDSRFDAPPDCTTNPVFGAEATYELGAPGTDLAFGNLDANTGGTRDVAIALGTQIAIWLNDGSGGLAVGTPIATAADGVIVEDFTADGFVDLVAWKVGGMTVVERQHDENTRGTYLPEQALPGPFTGVVSVKLGFLDGAFNPDLLVQDGSERRVYTSNLGTLGTFSREETVGAAGDDLVVVDEIDGVSRDDAAFIDGAGAVKLARNTAGGFTTTTTIASGARPGAVGFGDFDATAGTDLMVGTTGGGVLYSQTAPGTFVEVAGTIDGITSPMQVIDANGDGTQDLVLTSGLVLQCPGTRVFSQRVGIPITAPYELVDLTKDGKPDLVRVDGSQLKVRIQQ
ncbi:MAG: hypothetical protein WKG01_23390 [Kofleriaceae bacterium]